MVHILAILNIIFLWELLCKNDMLDLNTLWPIDSKTITNESPAKMLEMKKSMGMNSEYHKGCILGLAIRKSAPRPDWCKVDNAIPNITTARVREAKNLRCLFAWNHSLIVGLNSINNEPI